MYNQRNKLTKKEFLKFIYLVIEEIQIIDELFCYLFRILNKNKKIIFTLKHWELFILYGTTDLI